MVEDGLKKVKADTEPWAGTGFSRERLDYATLRVPRMQPSVVQRVPARAVELFFREKERGFGSRYRGAGPAASAGLLPEGVGGAAAGDREAGRGTAMAVGVCSEPKFDEWKNACRYRPGLSSKALPHHLSTRAGRVRCGV